MKQIANDRDARLTYLKLELARRVSRSRFFDSRCHYTAPKSQMPAGVKKLMKEIFELEEELGKRRRE